MIRTSKPSCSLPSTAKGKPLLPLTARKKKQKVQVRTLLGHCLYRRVILWTIAVLSISALTLSKRGVSISKGETTIIKAENRTPAQTQTQRQTDEAENAATFMFLLADAYEKSKMKEERKSPQWLRFNRLDGFFQGLKTLVPAKDHRPEYPKQDDEQDSLPLSVTFSRTPTPTPYVPQPDYRSSQYVSSHHDVKPCYLDKKETIPVPNVLAYNGLPQGLPEPVIGSHKLFGLRDDVCFDRFGRYGPYGLGYSYDDGGLDVGMDTEKNGSQYVWAKTGKIDYSKVNWGDAQSRCLEANKDRFRQPPNTTTTAPTEGLNKEQKQVFQQHQRKKIPRTAIVVRLYVGFPWTEHSVLNFRAMISEVALQSGGEYTVHFLLHVRDNDEPIWADPKAVQKVLDDNVPPEFHSLCTLWSEDQMRLFYPGRFARSFTNPSFGDIHGVYRSAHFPLQHFAQEHPEYEHFWNWEMDMRWIGNYYELFDRLGAWAKKQSRHEMWERSERYYIPHYHGSWENFTQLVHNQTVASGRRPVMGPVQYPGYLKLRSEKRGVSFLPPTCPKDAVTIMKPRPYSNRLPQAKGKAHRHHHHHLRAGSPDDDLEATISTSSPSNDEDLTACGIDEDADLITLNPIFDADSSGWVFHLDITGYDRSHPPPPRRASIITASRMSRRLLNVMHEETYRFHHAMFTEMFPTTMALHHGLKAVYAPHPVYLDRQWDLETIDKTFNGGRDHTTSGKGSPYQYQNEYHHKGSTWYYDAQFAGTLWRRWLGYAQVEGPAGGEKGEKATGSGETAGRLRGGKKEEEEGTGRMCLRSMLVHPIKWEDPAELAWGK